jgi:hypothetical protein
MNCTFISVAFQRKLVATSHFAFVIGWNSTTESIHRHTKLNGKGFHPPNLILNSELKREMNYGCLKPRHFEPFHFFAKPTDAIHKSVIFTTLKELLWSSKTLSY